MATFKVEKNIYKRGEFSFQVKMKVGTHWVTETLDTLEQARDFRDSKRIAKNNDADYKRIVGSKLSKKQHLEHTVSTQLERYKREFTCKKQNYKAEEYRIGVIQRSRFGSLPFYAVDADDLTAFLNTLDCSDATKLKYVCVVSHLYNIARKHWKAKVQNPANDIVKPKANPHRERRVDDDEFAFLLNALNSKLRRNAELPILAKIARITPVRESELLTLTWSRVDLKQGTLLIPVEFSKTQEARTVPLYPEALEIFRELFDKRKNREHVFKTTQSALIQSWRRVVARGRKEYEVACEQQDTEPVAGFMQNLHFHDLRHESISQLYENTDLRDHEISMIAGHKSTNTTKIYTHLRAKNLVARFKENCRDNRIP